MSLYYLFVVVVVVRYETTATTRWASMFLVRPFFNDTITIALWTSFHVCLRTLRTQLVERNYCRIDRLTVLGVRVYVRKSVH